MQWAMTRKPGDLPAQSPNQRAEGPIGAVCVAVTRIADVRAHGPCIGVAIRLQRTDA
jgi:hypothetical protein